MPNGTHEEYERRLEELELGQFMAAGPGPRVIKVGLTCPSCSCLQEATFTLHEASQMSSPDTGVSLLHESAVSKTTLGAMLEGAADESCRRHDQLFKAPLMKVFGTSLSANTICSNEVFEEYERDS